MFRAIIKYRRVHTHRCHALIPCSFSLRGLIAAEQKYLERVIKHREKCRNSKPRRSSRCVMYEYHTSQSTARGAKRLFLRWRCHAMKLHQVDLRSRTTPWRSLNSVSLGKNNFLVYLMPYLRLSQPTSDLCSLVTRISRRVSEARGDERAASMERELTFNLLLSFA